MCISFISIANLEVVFCFIPFSVLFCYTIFDNNEGEFLMIRIIAILILFIPGLIAAIGIKLMRDTLFATFYPIFLHSSIQFIIGLILFLAGLAFIGGFIIHRDRKRQKNQQQKRNCYANGD